MDYLNKIIGDIENHSVEGIRECFDNGIGANDLFRNEPLIFELTSEYLRSPRFKKCVKLFIDYGVKLDDEALLAVLSDDKDLLETLLSQNADLVNKKYNLRCAYTPLHEVTLLHICAEYNHAECAKVLVRYGADINAEAGLDQYGFGGQTPIFHTVNQNHNNSIEMLDYLISRDVDLAFLVKAIIWGKSYDWETLIPAVNPISYAMMGLLPQMHRDEKVISETVSKLLKAQYGIEYPFSNVPCKYLT